MRYRNTFGVEGSYLMNPRRRSRRRHRNPDLNRWLKSDHLVDGAMIGAGFLGADYVAQNVLHWDYVAPSGGSPDIMRLVQSFVARAGAGIVAAMGLEAADQGNAGEKVAAGAIAAGMVNVARSFGLVQALLPAPAAPAPAPLPVGGAGMGGTLPRDVRSNTVISPVYGL